MSCIGWDRELDPELHDFYPRNLLEPGWAGELSGAELAYVKAQLQRSPSLKRRWGFRPSARRLSEARIHASGYAWHLRRCWVSFSFAPTRQAARVDRGRQDEGEG